MLGWITQNLGTILAVLGGAGAVGGFIKSFHIVREYERAVVTGPRGNIIRDKVTEAPKEYRGVLIRLAGLYRVAVVNIKDRNDQILLDGVMRPTENGQREKWQLAATCRWNVQEGLIYEGCEWQVDDIGEYARGVFQKAIQEYLEQTQPSQDLSATSMFVACERRAREELREHGIVWTKLMINKFALADAEIQAQAIRQLSGPLSFGPSST